MSDRDDKAAANAARPRDYEYSDTERTPDYIYDQASCLRCGAFLDDDMYCSKCDVRWDFGYGDNEYETED